MSSSRKSPIPSILKDDSDERSPISSRQRLPEANTAILSSPLPPSRLPRTPGQSPEGVVVIEEDDNDFFPPPLKNDIQERLRVKKNTSQSSGQNPWASPHNNPQATGQYSVEEYLSGRSSSNNDDDDGDEPNLSSRSQSPHSNKSSSKNAVASRTTTSSGGSSSRPSLGEKSYSRELLQSYLANQDGNANNNSRQDRVDATAGASPAASMWSREGGGSGSGYGNGGTTPIAEDYDTESTDHMVTMKRGTTRGNSNNNSHGKTSSSGAFQQQHIFDTTSFPQSHHQQYDQHHHHHRGYEASIQQTYTDDESGTNDFELHSVQSDITGLTSAFPQSRASLGGGGEIPYRVSGGTTLPVIGSAPRAGTSVGLPHPSADANIADQYDQHVPTPQTTSQRLDELEQRIQQHQRSVGSSSQPASSATSRRNSVSFDTVNIREYPRILGNNPSCTSGPALSLGWSYTAQLRWHIDDFEMELEKRRGTSCRRSGRDLVLEREEREEMLLELGYTRRDLAQAVRKQVKSKNQRRRTVNNLGTVASNVEEKIETASRGVKRLFFFRKGKI